MKIDSPHSVGTTAVRGRRRSRAASGNSFVEHLSFDDGVEASGGGAPVAPANPLFALQEVDDPPAERRRAAERRASDILRHLDEIRHALLLGTLSQARLAALARIVRQERQAVDDPRLNEILDEIELRAEVELAKYARES